MVDGAGKPIDGLLDDLAGRRAGLADGVPPGSDTPDSQPTGLPGSVPPASGTAPDPQPPVPQAGAGEAGGPADPAPSPGAPRALRGPAAKIDPPLDGTREIIQYRPRPAPSPG